MKLDPVHLFLIRHGQSEANVDETVYYDPIRGKRDHLIELTELGRDQARMAGVQLKQKLDKNYRAFISPYKRTLQTWEEIKKSLISNNIKEEVHSPLLREQEFKIFKDQEDSKAKKIEKTNFSPFYYRYKNAESQADVYLRVFEFLNYLRISRLEGKTSDVVVVAHEVVIRMFVTILDNKDVNHLKVDVANGEIIHREI